MRNTAFRILLWSFLSSAAFAQDGGKVTWRGKGGQDQNAMAEARAQGRAMMLFFTSEGSEDCKILSQGALSDPKVVEASQQISCIWVECQGGKKNVEMAKAFDVTSYPTLVFCDPEGKSFGTIRDPRPKSLEKLIKALADKFPPITAENPVPTLKGLVYSDARLAARRTGKPIAAFFYDDSPPSKSVSTALTDEAVKKLLEKFVFALIEFHRNSEEAAKFDVDRAPTILILDASLEKPEAKPLARIGGSRSSRELVRDLEDALALRGGEKTPEARKPEAPAKPPGPAETLSDDVIDRRFIRARVSVALESAKKGKKEKAIEILEDVIKTYPKHVETVAVRKILEDLQK